MKTFACSLAQFRCSPERSMYPVLGFSPFHFHFHQKTAYTQKDDKWSDLVHWRLGNHFLHNDGRWPQNGGNRSPLTSMQHWLKIFQLSFKVPGYPLEHNYIGLFHLRRYATVNFASEEASEEPLKICLCGSWSHYRVPSLLMQTEVVAKDCR